MLSGFLPKRLLSSNARKSFGFLTLRTIPQIHCFTSNTILRLFLYNVGQHFDTRFTHIFFCTDFPSRTERSAAGSGRLFKHLKLHASDKLIWCNEPRETSWSQISDHCLWELRGWRQPASTTSKTKSTSMVSKLSCMQKGIHNECNSHIITKYQKSVEWPRKIGLCK